MLPVQGPDGRLLDDRITSVLHVRAARQRAKCKGQQLAYGRAVRHILGRLRCFEARLRHVAQQDAWCVVPVDLEKQKRLARGQHGSLGARLQHIVVHLRQRHSRQPPGHVFKVGNVALFRRNGGFVDDVVHAEGQLFVAEHGADVFDAQLRWRFVFLNKGEDPIPRRRIAAAAAGRPVHADLVWPKAEGV